MKTIHCEFKKMFFFLQFWEYFFDYGIFNLFSIFLWCKKKCLYHLRKIEVPLIIFLFVSFFFLMKNKTQWLYFLVIKYIHFFVCAKHYNLLTNLLVICNAGCHCFIMMRTTYLLIKCSNVQNPNILFWSYVACFKFLKWIE